MGRDTSNRGKNQLPDHRSHYSRLASFKLLLREDSARKAKPGCGITIPSDITEHYYLSPFFHGGFASCLIRSPDTPWIPRGRINGPLWFGPLSLGYLVYQTDYLVSVPSPVRQQCLLCFFFPSPRRLSWLLVLHHPPGGGVIWYLHISMLLPSITLICSSLLCSFLFLPTLPITPDLSCFPLVCFSILQSFRQCPLTVYTIATISIAPLYAFSQFLLSSRVASLSTVILGWSARLIHTFISVFVPLITDDHVLLGHGSSLLHSP